MQDPTQDKVKLQDAQFQIWIVVEFEENDQYFGLNGAAVKLKCDSTYNGTTQTIDARNGMVVFSVNRSNGICECHQKTAVVTKAGYTTKTFVIPSCNNTVNTPHQILVEVAP